VSQVYNDSRRHQPACETTLRWVLGKHDLTRMLAERDKLNADIQDGRQADRGVRDQGTTVEITRIDPSTSA